MEERIMRFAGKNVVITGGSSGIGLATAQRVATEGGRVLITGTNQRRIDEAVAGLPEGRRRSPTTPAIRRPRRAGGRRGRSVSAR
jgi:NAD(P)-dependent dehydrogenase (short-subunit alcohol dehydrogenase family)